MACEDKFNGISLNSHCKLSGKLNRNTQNESNAEKLENY